MLSLVTVLIPFYNSGPFLPLAIQSVFNQSYKYWKMVLIDDASSEKYLPSIRKFLTDSRVTLVKHTHNQGQSKALNTGLKYVKTPFVVQLDSDDLFYPYTLQTMVREAVKLQENVGLLCGNMKIIFEEDRNGKKKWSRIRKGGNFEDPYDFLLANKTLCPRFYRTAALKKIGGWPTDDPYEGRYVEDLRVLYRLIGEFKFHWIDKELYITRIHQNNHTKQVKKYVEIIEWSVSDTLQRLGDKFEAVYEEMDDGWIRIAYLKPKIHHDKEDDDTAEKR
jgi:glycosyltransferase involved in cell wall biosynthesis